jgi:DNA-binding transcriptional LysR family regulator
VRVDWEDLRVLVELANYGSLSATARALGVTHVTISRRIANLEMDLGQPLFTRESGRYVLTEAGKRTLELAGPMAQSADAIVRAASSLHAKLIGPVRITAAAAVGIHIVMPGLREVRARHPDIDVDLRITDQNVNLARGDADIAVRLARPAGSSGIVSTKVAELAYYLYGARSYVDGREPELFEYIGYAIEETDRPEAATLDNLARGRRTAMRINHLGNRIEATRLGLGLALLPSVMAEICPELIRVSSGGPLMQRDVYVLVHEDLKEVPRVKACLDVLVGAIRTRSDGPH